MIYEGMLRPSSMYDNVPPLPATLSAQHQQQRRSGGGGGGGGSPSNRSLRPPSHVPSLQDLSELRHGDFSEFLKD